MGTYIEMVSLTWWWWTLAVTITSLKVTIIAAVTLKFHVTHLYSWVYCEICDCVKDMEIALVKFGTWTSRVRYLSSDKNGESQSGS